MCVPGSRVVQAAHWLEETQVKVAAVVGFPLGNTDSDAKRYEAEMAIDLGAQELDLVINIGRIKEGEDRQVLRELRDVVEAADGVPVKVILECCLLTEEEKRRACSLVVESTLICREPHQNSDSPTISFSTWLKPMAKSSQTCVITPILGTP